MLKTIDLVYEKLANSFWSWLIPITLFGVLASVIALVQVPVDEDGMHFNIIYNLLTSGVPGTGLLFVDPLLGLESPLMKGIERFFYHMPPGAFFQIAVWFFIFGSNLFVYRSFGIFMVIVGILAWRYFLKKMGIKDKKLLFATILLFGTDFIVTRFASARPFDPILMGHWLLAIALYVGFREKSLNKALFFSQLSVMYSGLVHPNGLFVWAEMVIFIFIMDRKKLHWKHLIPYTIPYLIGGSFFTWHIMREFDLFKAQFFANVSNAAHPGFIDGLIGMIKQEFLIAYGWTLDVPVQGRLLIILLLVHIGGIFYAIWKGRHIFAVRITLYFLGIHLFFFTWIFTHKWPHYMIFFIPLFSFLTVWSFFDIIKTHPKYRRWIQVTFFGMILLSLPPFLYRYHKNLYYKQYAPDLETIHSLVRHGEKIYGNPSTLFILGSENI